MSKSQDLYTHAKGRIPGGVQLLSKRPEQFAPNQWPNYAVKAKGCEVWDLDGNHYYDMTTNGIGACLLGYADPDVNAAVINRIENGSMSTLNAPEEVHLAEKLIEIHPWAEQARFARCGGDLPAAVGGVRLCFAGGAFFRRIVSVPCLPVRRSDAAGSMGCRFTKGTADPQDRSLRSLCRSDRVSGGGGNDPFLW